VAVLSADNVRIRDCQQRGLRVWLLLGKKGTNLRGGLLCHARAAQQRGMPEADARWLFQQLLVAVEYCHLLGIANRDVKVPLPPHLSLPTTRYIYGLSGRDS